MEHQLLSPNRLRRSSGDDDDAVSQLLDDLRQDHAQLCGGLGAVTGGESGHSTRSWQSLRDVCARLSTGLQEHIRREERLPLTRHRSLGAAAPEAMLRPSNCHYNHYRYLQVITRYITLGDRPLLLSNQYQLVQDFLNGLRRNMDQQEAELFPAIEQAATDTADEALWNR